VRGVRWHGASETAAGSLSTPSLVYRAPCKVGMKVCSLQGRQCHMTNQPQDPAPSPYGTASSKKRTSSSVGITSEAGQKRDKSLHKK